jgi:hypothetical protein
MLPVCGGMKEEEEAIAQLLNFESGSHVTRGTVGCSVGTIYPRDEN